MRKILILLTIIVILPVFSLSVTANEDVDEYINDFEDIIPDGLDPITEDSDSLIESISPRSLFTEILYVISEGGGSVAAFFLRLMGVTILMSLCPLLPEKFIKHTEAAVGVICSLLIFESLSPLIASVSETVIRISDFFASLIPIAVGITALGGGASTSLVQAGGMYAALSAVNSLWGRLFLGISSFGLAMALLSALGNGAISSVAKGVKQLFNRVLGISTALLTAVYSLQSIISSAADSAAMRAAKYAASGLIPIVGTTVAGAISTLTAGLSYARSIVGGGAIAVIVYLALAPLVLILLYRLALSVVVIFADFTGAVAASRILSSYRFALDMTLSAYSLSALVYVFLIIVFLRIGVDVI